MTVIYLRYDDLEYEIEADIKADFSPDYLIYIGVMALLGFVMLVSKSFFLIPYYKHIHTYIRTRKREKKRSVQKGKNKVRKKINPKIRQMYVVCGKAA